MTATNATVPLLLEADRPEKRSSTKITLTPFDRRHYQALIQARGETIRRVVTQIKPALELANALDVGCGIGFFSQMLYECGLYTRGFDGRMENVVEARKDSRGFRLRKVTFRIQTLLSAGNSIWCCASDCSITWKTRGSRCGTCTR